MVQSRVLCEKNAAEFFKVHHDLFVEKVQGFIARTRRIYNIELHIARKRHKLNNHFRKWEKLISVFT